MTKILDFFKQYRNVWLLIILLVIILICGLLFVFGSSKNNSTSTQTNQLITASNSPTNQDLQTQQSTSVSLSEFRIVSVLPAAKIITDLTQQFQITFSQEINPKDFRYTTTPFIPLVIEPKDKHTLIFTSKGLWQNYTEYQISILNATKNNKGFLLDRTYFIKFKTEASEQAFGEPPVD